MAADTVARVQDVGASDSEDISVLIVDDAIVIRGLISKMIAETNGMRVAGSVPNGEVAIRAIGKQEIDIIVLDIEMPVMDGLTALPHLVKADASTQIIMASTLTGPNAEASLKALELGAADYIPKPTSNRDIGGVGGSDEFKRALLEKVAVLGKVAKKKRVIAKRRAERMPSSVQPETTSNIYGKPISLRAANKLARRPKILAVGTSTGGPQALMTFLSELPVDINIPVVVTQHMPPSFTAMLANNLNLKTSFKCVEATDGMILTKGEVAIAPGDYHMTVVGTGDLAKIRLNQDPPENFCRPAVDPMLRSVSDVFGERVLTVILTGMGSDGLKGGQAIVDAGGELIAQDEASSVVWGMPGAVATAGLCTAVLPLADLPAFVADRIRKSLP